MPFLTIPTGFPKLLILKNDQREWLNVIEINFSKSPKRLRRVKDLEEYEPPAFSVGWLAFMPHKSTIQQDHHIAILMSSYPGTTGSSILWKDDMPTFKRHHLRAQSRQAE
jgi:hypothetical protein